MIFAPHFTIAIVNGPLLQRQMGLLKRKRKGLLSISGWKAYIRHEDTNHCGIAYGGNGKHSEIQV
ncbi:hypothetical protein LCGC14_1755310 [marine sediment metagenome]|uniref:Uncharacterized protein n=1 Tax=marine sediment metagenome TaxID=412755 RepID=A0A0F9JHV4_9ZZZZ